MASTLALYRDIVASKLVKLLRGAKPAAADQIRTFAQSQDRDAIGQTIPLVLFARPDEIIE